MLYITFNVYKQKIKRTDTQQIVSDSRNYLHAAITFSDDDWTGIKTAVFKNGDVVKHAVLDDNNECLVPWEVIKPGILHVSVFCGDLITADTATVYINESGYYDGGAPEDPSPTVYEQIIAMLNEIETLTAEDVQRIVDEYVAAHKDELKGDKGDTGNTPNFTIGTVETLPSGSDATASITGDKENPVLNLGIPKGADGHTPTVAEITPIVETVFDNHKSEFVQPIDNNSIVKNTSNEIEVADYEELRQKYGGFTPIGVDIPLEWNLGQYWNTASKSISTSVTNGQWARVEIEPNAKYTIKGNNFWNGRLLGVYDENMELLLSYPSESNTSYYEYEFTVPSNAKWLYTNTLTSGISVYSLQKKTGRIFNGFDTFQKDRLYGKSLLVFGDSIARGARANNNAFGEQIASRCGMTVTNIAVGGASLASLSDRTCIVDMIKNHTVSNYDYIVFNGGTNDFEQQAEVGTLADTYTDSFDATTTIGALEEICKYIKANYINSKVLFVLTHKRIKYPTLSIRQTTYFDAIITVLKKWSIPYVDLRECGLADFGTDWEQTYFSNDQGGDTHPNELGYAMFYVPTIEQKMQSL